MADTAYIVLEANSGEQLAVLVNGALEQGWVTQGGISVCQIMYKPLRGNLSHFLAPQRMSFAQALTKTKA